MNSSTAPACREATAAAQPQTGHKIHDQTRPDRALMLTQEIAQDAHAARGLLRECSDASNDPESAEALIAALIMAICKMGLLADMATAELGGMQSRGGADSWLMPDAYSLAGAH